MWTSGPTAGITTCLSTRSVAYFQFGDELRQAGYDYDVLDSEAVIERTRVAAGVLATPTEQFKAMVIPQIDAVSRPMLARASELAADGGIVILVGGLPRHSIETGSDDPEVCSTRPGTARSVPVTRMPPKPNPSGPGGTRAASVSRPPPRPLWPLLREAAAPDLAAAAGIEGLCSYHRRLDGGDLYLILNRKPERRTVSFTLSARGRPEKWSPLTGRVEPIADYEITPQGTRITLAMAADEIAPIVIRPAGAADAPPRAPEVVLKEVPIPGPFRFRAEQTMNRPHINWNFTQEADGWTVATTQPAFLPNVQTASVPDTLPARRLVRPRSGQLLRARALRDQRHPGDRPHRRPRRPGSRQGGRQRRGQPERPIGRNRFRRSLSPGRHRFPSSRAPITSRSSSPTRWPTTTVSSRSFATLRSRTAAPSPPDKVSGLLGPVTLRVLK